MDPNKLILKAISTTALTLLINPAFSFTLMHGHVTVQAGGYWSNQGKAQHINIVDVIGDDFTLNNGGSSNGLFGVGYFVDGNSFSVFKMTYGVNAFYLANTSVNGDVVQESLFTNLSYSYKVRHIPVLAVAKALIDTKSPKYGATLEVGIGPNFMQANSFHEHSLDSITLPDNIFANHSSTSFSAMVGAGLRLNNIVNPAALECGYKFFYLGQGNLAATSNQVLNNLETGTNFGNALVCSVTV